MRPLLSALVIVLLAAVPAVAQSNNMDNLGSEQQTDSYGKLFGYVGAFVAVAVVILGGYIVVKQMLAESARGKKIAVFTDILDEKDVKRKLRQHEIPLYLGEKVPDWKLKTRLQAVEAALGMLGKKDDWWDAKLMTQFVRAAYLGVKDGITQRATKKLEKQLTPKCLEGIREDVAKLKKNGQYHVLDRVEIESVRIVHFEAAGGFAEHTFLALVAASSRDFYMDDKTKEVVRGDKKYYEYQEFWLFKRSKAMWLVDRIRSAEDMDRLLEPKLVLKQADLDRLAKTAEPELMREFVAK